MFPDLIESVGLDRYRHDKGCVEQYNLTSALIKSLRNSDADAGLYWLARLIEGGADPVFIARRLCILASEDVGLADPQAMVQASAAAQIVQLIGLPEGLYVDAVQAGGPAATAGIRAGDVITQIEGQPATSPDQLIALTITKKAGDKVNLTYVRAGSTHETTVTLGSQSP